MAPVRPKVQRAGYLLCWTINFTFRVYPPTFLHWFSRDGLLHSRGRRLHLYPGGRLVPQCIEDLFKFDGTIPVCVDRVDQVSQLGVGEVPAFGRAYGGTELTECVPSIVIYCSS